jgi:hypothetical protein
MKIIVAFIVLSSIIGPQAIAGDSTDALRNARTICNQFVIPDPDPGNNLNEFRDCCFPRNRVRDCKVDIWNQIDR